MTGGRDADLFDRDSDDPVQVLDESGELVGDLPPLSDAELVELYRLLRLARHFDERAVSRQRQGRMGTYPPLAGQEAAQVGSAATLDDQRASLNRLRERRGDDAFHDQ